MIVLNIPFLPIVRMYSGLEYLESYLNSGKTISSKSSVFDSTKQRISNVLTNSWNSG
jgi:hypothetical protein